MIKICKMFLFIGIVMFLVGCGGGGGNGDDDGFIDPQTSMIGTWQPISAIFDGLSVKVSEIMPDTDEEATRWEMDFNQNGTCMFRGYNSINGLIETINGTWSSDNQIAPVKIDGETTDIHWSDQGNIMTANYEIDGKPVLAKWVRIDPIPTDHNSLLIGNWRVSTVEVNGVNKSISEYFEWDPGSDSEILTLSANGTGSLKEMDGSNTIDTQNGTWGDNGGVLLIAYGPVKYWGYWEGQLLTYVMLEPDTGDSVKLVWTKVP